MLNPTGCVPYLDPMQLHYTESCRLQAGDKYLFADVPMLCVACSSVVDLLRMTLTAFSRRVLPQADLGSGLLFGSDWRRLLLLHSPAEPLYHKYLTVSFASGLLCMSSPTPPCLSFSYCKSVLGEDIRLSPTPLASTLTLFHHQLSLLLWTWWSRYDALTAPCQ